MFSWSQARCYLYNDDDDIKKISIIWSLQDIISPSTSKLHTPVKSKYPKEKLLDLLQNGLLG